jgi:uncharacterized membrane protein YdjX (TVP38/TMEM64 family)
VPGLPVWGMLFSKCPACGRNGCLGKGMKKICLILFVLAIIVSGCFLFFYYDLPGVFSSEEKVLQAVADLGQLSILAFMLLQVVQVIITPIPGEVTGIIGGYLFGPILGTVYSTIGLTIGSCIAFSLARAYGLPFVERVVPPSATSRYDTFMKGRGRLVCFAFFVLPGMPKDMLCYIMGLSHMTAREFMVIITAGRLLGACLLSVAGSSVRSHQNGNLLIIAGACAVLALSAYCNKKIFLRTSR